MKRVGLVVGLVLCVVMIILLLRRDDEERGVEDVQARDAKMVTENVSGSVVVSDSVVADELASLKAEVVKRDPVLSESVRVLAGLDGQDADYKTRLAAMRELGRDLALQDVEALMAFMRSADVEVTSMRPIELNSIRNDLMEVLLRQNVLPEGLGSLLVGVLGNREHGSMWRNYCLQFMTPYYERRFKDLSTGQPSDTEVTSDGELQLVEQAMWQALDERDNSNAGTALLGLNELSEKFPVFDEKQVQAAMVDLAQDAAASEANRITALRLCGEQGHAEALKAARMVAQQGETVVLRCAAIATLGDLGGDEERFLLEEYAVSGEPRIARIAQMALEKMVSRM